MKPVYLIALLGIVLAACNQRTPDSPAQTTKGAATAMETPGQRPGGCDQVPAAADLKRLLREAPGKGEIGGLAGGRFEWAATVDRNGAICAIAVSTDDAAASWPGSRAIAMAKAFTANAFSTDALPMSTARLYTLTQPGHSLWGAAAANPFNPKCLAAPGDNAGVGQVCGGSIVFGGGVALYKGKTRVGALGASGDTSCADHEMAKRMREAANLMPEKGNAVDDIVYTSVDGPGIFNHPLCPNTWRDGKKIGDEPPAKGY